MDPSDTLDDLLTKTDEYNEVQMENEKELMGLVEIRMNAYQRVPKILREQYAARFYILMNEPVGQPERVKSIVVKDEKAEELAHEYKKEEEEAELRVKKRLELLEKLVRREV